MQVPVVGDVRPSSTALRGPSGEGGTPEAFGAAVGRGIGDLANTAGQLGDYFSQRFEQAQRFTATQNLSAFESRLNDEVTRRSLTFDPSKGASFVKDIQDVTSKEMAAYINTLPPNLKDEYQTHALQVTNSIHNSAFKYQVDAMGNYAKDGIEQQFDASKKALDADGSAANLDVQRARLDALINNAPITPAEKTAIRRQKYAGMEAVSYKSEVMKGKLQADSLGVGSHAAAGAYSLIKEFTNASDDEAKNTARASERIANMQVGNLLWADQTDQVKAGLVSLVSQTGELPDTVVAALKTGGDVAAAVEALGGDRHKLEAEIIRGNALLPQAAIEQDPRYANIPYEDRLALRADAEREATATANAQVTAQNAKDASVVNALFVGINDGTAGQADLDALRGAGILTKYEDIKKAQDLLDKATGDLQLQAQGINMITSGQTFNPSDPDHVKIENALVGKTGMQALQQQDSQYAADTLVPLVRQMQDVPPDVAGLLKGMIRSNDPKKALWAYDTLSQLQDASPQGYSARVGADVESNVELWRNGKDYYPQDKLMEMLQGGDSQEMRVRTEALHKEADGLLNDSKIGPTLTGDVLSQMGVDPGGFFKAATVESGFPQARDALMSDFRDLFKTEYGRSGNAEQAKATALKLLKKDWAVTPVGGGDPVLMKYPPQTVGYTPIGGSYDWMTEQGRADLRLGPNDKFQLVSDDQTRSEFERWQQGQGAGPSYKVVIKGEDGNWRLFEPWAPTGNRLAFDMKPFVVKQAEEWGQKHQEVVQRDAAMTLGLGEIMRKETSLQMPSDVQDHNIGMLMPQGQPMGTIDPAVTGAN